MMSVVKFLSTPSARRATGSITGLNFNDEFLSTPSARRATDSTTYMMSVVKFLSTPSARRATFCRSFFSSSSTTFLSTPSARRATRLSTASRSWTAYFYPRPPRGGRLLITRQRRCSGLISIHALREEGDSTSRRRKPERRHFYPRPPRGGRHVQRGRHYYSVQHFYPRPPRGGRPCLPILRVFIVVISIHALREEGDLLLRRLPNAERISIHALREEGDMLIRTGFAWRVNFYPRPPRGGRPSPVAAWISA